MQTRMKIGLVLALLIAVASVAAAGDSPVTLTGKIACAKCTLKQGGPCQDVLVVTGDNAGQYYIAKNAVFDKFGHTCRGEKAATVTGTVMEKDGHKWITATQIELVKS